MSQTFSTNFRQNIIRFTWTWVTLLLFVGIISLFSIWSMNRAYHQASQHATAILQLNNHILSARIDFKIQVQEWKNILLRGKQAEDRLHYQDLFQQQINKVQQSLSSASQQCAELQLNTACKNIDTVLKEHQQLVLRYHQQLAHASFADYQGIHQLDQSVRGIDRQLDSEMDRLNNQFNELQAAQSVATTKSLDQRYHNLRQFSLIVMSLALVITTFSLYRLLRNMRQ